MAANGPQHIEQERNLSNKRIVNEWMQEIANSTPDAVPAALAKAYAKDSVWRGSHPLNEVANIEELASSVWQPFLKSFTHLERRDEILVGGRYRNKIGETRDLVAMVGHYIGTFRHDWLNIPATGQPVFIRYGEVHELQEGKIIRSSCIWDILDVIRQAGFWPLPPSTGTEGLWLGPYTGDGLVFSAQDMDQGMASIAQTLAMHKTLGDYNNQEVDGRDGLLNMAQKEHWHEKMMWYGPSGIGTTRGLDGFVDFHQMPFRLAFPGRTGGQNLVEANPDKEMGHYIQIGDGPYSVTGGWPSVVSPHTGGMLFGVGPTNKNIEMRVMDFYLHHENKIRENWVPIDVIHILLQMGVDVMARVRDQFSRNRLGLK